MTTTLDWYGCATFRLTIDELVVFCDAYLDRVPSAPQADLRPEQVERADYVIVGHSHFDHLWGAERIALNTGATIVGSYETIRVMADLGVPDDQLLPVQGGERVGLAPGVTCRVFPSLHSCVWTDPPMPEPTEVCLGDLGVLIQEQRARLASLRENFAALDAATLDHLSSARQGERGDGGALAYLIDTPAGSVWYQDTAGMWTGVIDDLAPDWAIIAAAGRANIDGEPIQGTLAGYVADAARRLATTRVLLAHHDDWMPGFSIDTDVEPIRAALAEVGAQLHELGYADATVLFG